MQDFLSAPDKYYSHKITVIKESGLFYGFSPKVQKAFLASPIFFFIGLMLILSFDIMLLYNNNNIVES